MAVNLNLPSRQAGTTEQQLNGLYSYLYQLVETLNVSLNKDTSGQKVLYKAGGGVVSENTSPLPGSTVEEYQNLKALIIKTATEVTSNIKKIVTEISQEYIAQSEFGTYEEYLNNKITQGADGYLMEWDAVNGITTNVASFSQYIAQSDVYMRIGIVKYNDDGTVEAGVVVGKNFQKVTVDGKEYIISEDVYALFTAEEISFWQSGVCFSRLSLTGLQTSVAQLDKLITSVIESEGGDATLALDGGLMSAIAKKIDLTANESISLIVGGSASALRGELDEAKTVLQAGIDKVDEKIKDIQLGEIPELDELEGVVEQLKQVTDGKIEDLNTRLDLIPGQITAEVSKTEAKVTELSAEVDENQSATVAELERLQSQIDLIPGKISLSATETKALITELETRVDGNDARVSGEIAELEEKVDDNDNRVSVELTELQSQIDLIPGKISLAVSESLTRAEYNGVRIHGGQLAQDESLADQGIRVYSEYSFEQAEGTPSPTNVLPITGRSSAKLIRCGKNLCDMSAMTPSAASTIVEHGTDTVRVYNNRDGAWTSTKSPTIVLRGGVTYALSATLKTLASGAPRVCLRTTANKIISATNLIFSAVGSKKVAYTPSEDIEVYVSAFATGSTAAAGDVTFANIQLELGDTATAYERYSGDTYEVDLGGMRSGRLDWASGRFAADRGLVSFDGTENWKYLSTATYPYWYYDFADYGTAINDKGLCSHFARLEITSTTNNIGINIWNATATNACRIGVRPGLVAVTDLAAWKEYLAAQAAAGTPVQVAYELTEPETVQLEACPVWAAEGLNTVIADGVDGRIEFGHDSLAQHLQSQINLVPDKITLAVTESKEYTDDAVSDVTATGVKTKTSSVVITKDEVRINSEATTIAIPAADSADGEEIVTIDDEGLRTTVLTADEIHSDSVMSAVSGRTYTPANAGELQAIFDGLKCRYLTSGVTIDASAVSGGSCTLRGIQAGGIFKITNGTLNALKLMHCRCHVQIENMTFDSSGTAVEAQTCEYVYLKNCVFNAAEGLNAIYGANVVLNACTGVCATLLRSSSGSTVSVNGISCPSGVLGSSAGEVYSLFEFTAAETEPEASEVTTATLTTNNSRTWGGGWLSTDTFGKALYQGTTGDGELRRGCMWFPLTAISGKEIISATLTLKRVSGIGGGGAVTVGIYGTTATGASGTPAIGTKYAELSLANGASGSVDITAAVKALAAGSIKGLMIYDSRTGTFNGKNYTYGYCKLYGDGSGSEPSISVTYK